MMRTSLKETYSFGYGIFVQVQPVLVLVLNRFPFLNSEKKNWEWGIGSFQKIPDLNRENGIWISDFCFYSSDVLLFANSSAFPPTPERFHTEECVLRSLTTIY